MVCWGPSALMVAASLLGRRRFLRLFVSCQSRWFFTLDASALMVYMRLFGSREPHPCVDATHWCYTLAWTTFFSFGLGNVAVNESHHPSP